MARILIVDDNDQDRYMGQVLLESYGHTVEAASNGSQALRVAHSFKPQLVITDVLMPDMDGFALCRAWNADETLRQVPLIVYTATYTDSSDEKLALQLGAARFVRKPSEPSVMMGIIKEVLDGVTRGDRETSQQAPAEEVYLRQYNSSLVRKLEEKVRQLELTQMSVDQAATAILWVDASGAVSYANLAAKAALDGDGRGLEGRTLWSLQQTLTPEGWRTQYWDVCRSAGSKAFSADLTRTDGSTFPAEMIAYYCEKPPQSHIALFITDLTERQMLEQRVRQAQRLEAMGRVASGVAHDFNNLLFAMDAYLELAENKAGSNAAIRADLHEARGGIERAARLTKQLLAFSRQQTLQPARLPIDQVIREFAGLLQHALGPEHALDLQLTVDTAELLADRGQLEQVLMNLVVNARDALPDGGTVRLETALHEGSVRLTVADAGTGMDKETKGRIFEPFFTTKAVGKGTGLGMATVYGIVEQSGGHIEVESEPNQGTRIHLFLPAPPRAGVA